MFSSELTLPQLALGCRSLSSMLEAGIPAFRAFELTAENSSFGLRRAMEQVVAELKRGADVSTAVDHQKDYFPELFRNMVHVGDETGNLPEVLRSLADHYDNTLRLRRDFYSEITLPLVQFLAAIIIIGGLIWILGMISDFKGNAGGQTSQPPDILGWGLRGNEGVVRWFSGWAAALTGGFVLYLIISRFNFGLRTLHRILLNVPVIGRCLQSFALARFSWAYHLTNQAGLAVDKSLNASLNATGNAHFQGACPGMVADLMRGATVTETFQNSKLFPRDYLQMVSVGETTGTVPEILNRLSPQFEDQARRSLKLLATAAASVIWGGVAAFIVLLVFRIAMWYGGMIDQATDSAFGG